MAMCLQNPTKHPHPPTCARSVLGNLDAPPQTPVRPRKRARKLSDSEHIWRMLRGPFFMPEGLHRCQLNDWELFDCDAAGCRVCGALHACGPDVCPLVDANGWQVCEITGF